MMFCFFFNIFKYTLMQISNYIVAKMLQKYIFMFNIFLSKKPNIFKFNKKKYFCFVRSL